jgi:hypothetical protein
MVKLRPMDEHRRSFDSPERGGVDHSLKAIVWRICGSVGACRVFPESHECTTFARHRRPRRKAPRERRIERSSAPPLPWWKRSTLRRFALKRRVRGQLQGRRLEHAAFRSKRIRELATLCHGRPCACHHDRKGRGLPNRDGRDKPGHDKMECPPDSAKTQHALRPSVRRIPRARR